MRCDATLLLFFGQEYYTDKKRIYLGLGGNTQKTSVCLEAEGGILISVIACGGVYVKTLCKF